MKDGTLIERLRSSAKAFRENPIYDSEGDGCYLGVQADECDEAAEFIEAMEAALKPFAREASAWNEDTPSTRLIVIGTGPDDVVLAEFTVRDLRTARAVLTKFTDGPNDLQWRGNRGVSMSEPTALEFRPDHKGEFDEIVARFADGLIHFEMMSDTSLYVGFYWDDGRYCQTWISSKRKLRVHHEDGMTKPPRFTAWGVEQRARDSGSDRNGEDPVQQGSEGGASQSGAEGNRPTGSEAPGYFERMGK